MKKRLPGFTLVEMLIVTVIIAVLAGFVIVAYNGTQTRSRDSKRYSDISAIGEAIQLYRQKYQNDVTTTDPTNGKTCGDNGGNGWLEYTATAGNETMLNCLQNVGYANGGSHVDPSGCIALSPNVATPGQACDGTSAYMKFTCASVGTYGDDNAVSFLYAELAQPPNGSNNFSDLTSYSSSCDGQSAVGSAPSAPSVGMNYVYIVQ